MGANGRHRARIAQDPIEGAIRELAGRQLGNFTRRQLLALGLGSNAIRARLDNGSWVTRYHGVYCQAPARQDPKALIAAAVLAGGPTALASHTSAAFLWGFQPHFQHPPEISLPTGDRRPRHILTHRCPSLDRPDISYQHGVKVTSRARTLLDIAPTLTPKQLTRITNNALRERHLRQPALQDLLTRNPYHPGTKLLTPFLDLPGTNPTASHLEDLFLAFIAKHDLPVPIINFDLRRKQLDAYFPDHNLIVEVDGWDYHKDRQAFEEDRERDAENLRHGTPTVRMTEQRLTTDDDREATRLRHILDQATRRAGGRSIPT